MRTLVKKLNMVLLLVLLAAGLFCPLRPAAADLTCYQVSASLPVSVEVNGNHKLPFTLEIRALDGAPLPDKTTLTFTGGGSGAFGPITYTAPGDYRYEITQRPGSAGHVTYDDSVYTVSVFVTNLGEDQLQEEIKMWRGDGSQGKSDAAHFQNHYTDPPAAGGGTQHPATPAPTAAPDATLTAVSGSAAAGGLLPQTGDDFPLAALVVLCLLAALCLGVVLCRKYRNHHKP